MAEETQKQLVVPVNIIADFRERARRNEPLTPDEVRAGLAAIRESRRSAAEAAGTKKKSNNSAPARSAEQLLGLFNNPSGQDPAAGS